MTDEMQIQKPPKSRKPHRKSRNGCIPCKARHVKCDETRPSCVNCDKYSSKCEYPKPKGTRSSDSTHSPVGASTPSSTHAVAVPRLHTESESIVDASVSLSINQLRLLHHFTTATAPALAAHHDAEEIFSSYLPKLAFDSPFLLHEILALAALHLGRLERNDRVAYLLQAHLHHDAALASFRVHVKDIDESNYQAVLAFSSILFPYSLAISVDTSNDLEHAFNNLLSNLILTRGVGPMLTEMGFYDEMRKSPLGRIIPKDVLNIDVKQEVPAETELVQLRKFGEAIHHVYPPDIVEAYKDAIHTLEILFELSRGLTDPPSDSLLKFWVHRLSPRFVELLAEKQPGALIIFAHYGVFLDRGRRYWYREGVDEQILHVAENFVPAEWRSWLDWPMEQIRGSNTTTTADTS